jgi:hypothetical protein
MLIYHDHREEEHLQKPQNGRQHPWIASECDPNGRYYDFKTHPELIETSLEDFLPYADRAAIQHFFRMMRWLNGPHSILESNDCKLKPLEPNGTPNITPAGLQITGRLAVFFRDLQFNTQQGAVVWLCGQIKRQVEREDTDKPFGCIGYALWPHDFMELKEKGLPIRGHAVCLRFWSWGDDERKVFKNLDRTFKALERALRATSIAWAELRRGSAQSGGL